MSNATKTDTFNGWANRETWALNLHLSNDEGLYLMTLGRVAGANNAYDAGYRVIELFEDIRDGEYGQADWIDNMVRDVGSAWRIDVTELGAAWLENLSEQG